VSLAVLLDEYDPDIIAVSETLLSFDITTFEFFPNQYNVFRKEQVDSYGGVLFARWNSINCQELVVDTSAEAVLCKWIVTNLS